MVSLAAFSVILIIIIVNEVYEKRTKRVKFYLSVRIIDVFAEVQPGGFNRLLLGRPLDRLRLKPRCFRRFVFRLLFPKWIIALSKDG